MNVTSQQNVLKKMATMYVSALKALMAMEKPVMVYNKFIKYLVKNIHLIRFVLFIEIKECKPGQNYCHKDATCITKGDQSVCRCNDGFAGNGQFCDGEKL